MGIRSHAGRAEERFVIAACFPVRTNSRDLVAVRDSRPPMVESRRIRNHTETNELMQAEAGEKKNWTL